MAGAQTTISIKDSAGTAKSMRAWDESGIGSGPFSFMHMLTDISQGEYEFVSASASAQALGATGAVGDYLDTLWIIPQTTSPGAVAITDGTSSPDVAMTVFVGGASSVSNLVPFPVSVGIRSVTGAWRVTTGSNVTVLATGNFT